jgi:RhtB (resistance to homoserine/threonine) family protein
MNTLPYLPEILTIATIHFLALISPGPDFIIVTRNSLVYSKRAGIYTALGLALGMSVHIAYSLIGLGLIIAQSIVLFSVIKFLGAGYLIYIGYKALTAHQQIENSEVRATEELDARRAFRMGLLTNITNPKVTLFFLSIFTLVISPATPLLIKLIMGGEMLLATFLWFSLVALLVSHRAVKQRVRGIQHYAEKVMGALLIALGIKLAFASSK